VPKAIVKVWIEEGCISCKVCEDLAPKVFLVEGDQACVVRTDAGKLFAALAEDIEQAARDCPVEVIKLAHRADDPPAP
jgi:ferredoxin